MAKAVQMFPQATKLLVPKLRTVAVEPTNHCNLSCKMCYSNRRKKGHMSLNLFKKVVKELATDFPRVNLGLSYGGESLLHPQFHEMLRYASSARSQAALGSIGFNTNGMLLNDATTNILVTLPADWVIVSLEGLGNVNDAIRIGCNYETVKANILNLAEKRNDSPKPEISINLTHSTQTQEQVDQFVNYWADHVDYVRVSGCLTENLEITIDRFFGNYEIQENRFCTWPFGYMAVLWNGDVVACCQDMNGQNILGNINTQTIKQVWSAKPFRAFRYAQVKNSFPCGKCTVWKPHFKLQTIPIGNLSMSLLGQSKQYKKCR